MILKKSKGGKGKEEKLRNQAIIILNKMDKKAYNAYSLGKMFSRSTKTISGIIKSYGKRYEEKFEVIHR